MSGEIVKYDNKLNQISFEGTGITDNLLKLFFTVVAKARDQGTDNVTISFDELKKLTADKSHYTDTEYKNLIKRLYKVLMSLQISYDSGDKFGSRTIFEAYEGSLDEQIVTIKVTPAAQSLFNSLEYNFTRFELAEFVRLPGVYPKQLYRLLKQYRHLGHYSVLIKDLRKYLDVPETYKTKDLTRRVLNPAVTTLINNVREFVSLRYEYSYKGKKAIRVIFSWHPEPRYRDLITAKEKEKNT